MIIGGLQKCSLIDYPGKIAAVIFTVGCNFRCRYCHNTELIIPGKQVQNIPVADIFSFLETRRSKLDGVCITGGEPTLHTDLPEFAEKIKTMGFLVKLDTNGTHPDMLQQLVHKKLVDYIAMDVKAPLPDYAKIVGYEVDAEVLERSIELIITSGIHHEFRTTVVKYLTTVDDLKKIAITIKGAERFYLQKFVPTNVYDPKLAETEQYTQDELYEIVQELKEYVRDCRVR